MGKVWGEGELAVVLGASLSEAGEAEAKEAIFGYTIANDVTARRSGSHDHHLAFSKGSFTFCPLGPWIDTNFTPGDQLIRSIHNQMVLRSAKISDAALSPTESLAWISKWMTLEPGDVVLTGAPPRVRDRSYLRQGDTFVCEIEDLGSLRNSVIWDDLGAT